MYRSLRLASLLLLSLTTANVSTPSFAQWTAEKTDRSISVYHDQKFVTTYQFRSGSKPIFWPIMGPDDRQFTREYPMVPDSTDEKHDHPHHRGLWMNFGDINGHDLWAEGKGKGYICQSTPPDVVISPDSLTIHADHLWRGGIPNQSSVSDEQNHGCNDPKAEELAKCKATYVISGNSDERVIDCYYQLTASQDLQFGDTKEGMFAIRVPEAMKVDNQKGHILASNGRRDAEAWGFPAQWVDYSGPTNAKDADTYGIAIMVHPKSFQASGRWHVRTYGLFAHNAFGAADFPALESIDKPAYVPAPGGYKLDKGKTIRFGYRVLFHRGAYDIEKGNLCFEKFSKTSLEP